MENVISIGSTQGTVGFVSSLGSRKVWVVNSNENDYEENFKGKVIKVPGNGKIIMDYLGAERFISSPVAPEIKLPNGEYAILNGKKMIGKPLRIVELSDDERSKIEGKTREQVEKEDRQLEARLKFSCGKCTFVGESTKGLKIHIATKHEDV